MVTSKKIITIIPARGGSARIPNKNIKNLAGKPMIVYTIEASIKSKFIDRTIVSTNDEQITKISKEYGAEVIIRPNELAKYNSKLEDALIHSVKEIEKEGYISDFIITLQPTSPLRNTDVIDKGINLGLETNSDSVVSVCEIQNYYLSGYFKDGYYIPEYSERPLSQNMPKKYRENGAFYMTKRDLLLEKMNRIVGRVNAIIMDPIDSIDIDTIEDFYLAEKLICLLSN